MNGLLITLDKIKPHQRVCVINLNIEGEMRRRLIDIGLIEDTEITCIGISPLGDPIAILIRGAVIALRKSVCKKITVSPLEEF